MIQHGLRLQEKRTLDHQETFLIGLQKGYRPEDYLNSSSSVYTIDTSKTRGTTFKIDTGGYVFSCLFNSGAEISCMNMETVAALGLTSQITPSSISVNTANGDHMGVAGDVCVNFKIGRKFSFTHYFVVLQKVEPSVHHWRRLHEETLHIASMGT